MTARLSRLAGTMPDRLVAKACGVKLGAVWRWRTAHGIPPARWMTPARHRRKVAAKWIAKHPDGALVDLAAHLGVHLTTACRIRSEVRGAKGPTKAVLLAWLAEQHESVATEDVAEWAGIGVHAARIRLARAGAIRVGLDDDDRARWVAP